ncbi:MAG: ABC transporter permease [Veillonella sp.]
MASLVANKLRSLSTMLGIIIGVAAVIALVSIGTGLSKILRIYFSLAPIYRSYARCRGRQVLDLRRGP